MGLARCRHMRVPTPVFDRALQGARIGLSAWSDLRLVEGIVLHVATVEAVRLAKLRGHFADLHPLTGRARWVSCWMAVALALLALCDGARL